MIISITFLIYYHDDSIEDLKNTINSIQHQRYDSNYINAVIINDASLNKELENLMNQYNKEGLDLRLISFRSKKGRFQSLMQSLRRVKGKYLMFIDTGTFIPPFFISELKPEGNLTIVGIEDKITNDLSKIKSINSLTWILDDKFSENIYSKLGKLIIKNPVTKLSDFLMFLCIYTFTDTFTNNIVSKIPVLDKEIDFENDTDGFLEALSVFSSNSTPFRSKVIEYKNTIKNLTGINDDTLMNTITTNIKVIK